MVNQFMRIAPMNDKCLDAGPNNGLHDGAIAKESSSS